MGVSRSVSTQGDPSPALVTMATHLTQMTGDVQVSYILVLYVN